MPAILVQRTSSIVITQARASLCRNRQARVLRVISNIYNEVHNNPKYKQGTLTGNRPWEQHKYCNCTWKVTATLPGILVLNEVASLIGLTPLTCAGRKYTQEISNTCRPDKIMFSFLLAEQQAKSSKHNTHCYQVKQKELGFWLNNADYCLL